MVRNAGEELSEEIGRKIVWGELPPGERFTLEQLMETSGKSRTVVREVMRDLEGLGLITSKRRVGLHVNDSASWRVFDPRIIRWRLEGPGASRQYQTLMDLRKAVEPVAAELFALRGDDERRRHLLWLAREMRREGEAGRLSEFLELDIAFHALILEGSGNEMFRALVPDVTEVLTRRTAQGLMPPHPEAEALALHEACAEAVAAGDAVKARAALRELVEEAAGGVERQLGQEQDC